MTQEARRMRLTGCMTFKRAVRTAKRLARSVHKAVTVYDCGWGASCFKPSTRPLPDTRCVRHAVLKAR